MPDIETALTEISHESSALVTTARDPDDVYRPPAALSPERFGFLWDIADRIASSSLVPETLRTIGPSNSKTALPKEQVMANVFFVVEQADRWNISPFALLPCASVVHGRLGFEGKVIDAVLEGVYGIKLQYTWSGEGEDMTIVVSGTDRHGQTQHIEGSVKEWKTTGNGSPWRLPTYKKMLAYRGAREWARIHKSVAMLGIVSEDELYDAELERRAHQATDVSSRPALDRFKGRAGDTTDAADINSQLSEAGAQSKSGADKSDGKSGAAASNEAERRSEGSADRSNGTEPSGKTPSSAQSKSSTGVTSGDGEQSPSGQLDLGEKTDVDMLRSFSKHLHTITDGGMKALRPAASKWREDNGGWPPNGNKLASDKMNSVYAIHSRRMAGEIDVASCDKSVDEAILA